MPRGNRIGGLVPIFVVVGDRPYFFETRAAAEAFSTAIGQRSDRVDSVLMPQAKAKAVLAQGNEQKTGLKQAQSQK